MSTKISTLLFLMALPILLFSQSQDVLLIRCGGPLMMTCSKEYFLIKKNKVYHTVINKVGWEASVDTAYEKGDMVKKKKDFFDMIEELQAASTQDKIKLPLDLLTADAAQLKAYRAKNLISGNDFIIDVAQYKAAISENKKAPNTSNAPPNGDDLQVDLQLDGQTTTSFSIPASGPSEDIEEIVNFLLLYKFYHHYNLLELELLPDYLGKDMFNAIIEKYIAAVK